MVEDSVNSGVAGTISSARKKTRSISPHSRLLSRRRRERESTTDGSDASSVSSADTDDRLPTIVAVTSCRSDAYYHQKAPGSASKLPSKAPSALKSFHELATGVKDAYEAVGRTPTRPDDNTHGDNSDNNNNNKGARVLWEFMGNLDFLLALVDEVAVDTATRGALKDDTTFRCLRDVIKKGNRVLEDMLVKRERRYTLFFRLVSPAHEKKIKRMENWNVKMEKAVGRVTTTASDGGASDTESEAEDGDATDGSETSSSSTSRGRGLVHRGRSMFAGGVKGRRATPTPRLRERYANSGPKANGVVPTQGSDAADDGFFAGRADGAGADAAAAASDPAAAAAAAAATSSPVDPSAVRAPAERFLPDDAADGPDHRRALARALSPAVAPVRPKEELLDVIRGLNEEKKRQGLRGSGVDRGDAGLAALRPDWSPKADVPSSVPRLPADYVHRHRLMRQVINCLLDRGTGPRDTDEEDPEAPPHCCVTSVTSRHTDKCGNGKTTLAVACVQSVEVRERFKDGICWIRLGRRPLTEVDIRGLYEDLHRQLCPDDEGEVGNEGEGGAGEGEDPNDKDNADDDPPDEQPSQTDNTNTNANTNDDGAPSNTSNPSSSSSFLSPSRRRFQGGELEGMKEDLYSVLRKRRVLICLDDVWSVEDAHWFLFHFKNKGNVVHPDHHDDDDDDGPEFRVLMTTRQPGLLGAGNAREVFVRILSEHEAVKLLLASAGRRPYGGRHSPVFATARAIVKGCGNSPLAVRLAGGALGRGRVWTHHSLAYRRLSRTCRAALEEATRARSFERAAGRVVDASLATAGEEDDHALRAALRRCLVAHAIAFGRNDHRGTGVPRGVLLRAYGTLIRESVDKGKENDEDANVDVPAEGTGRGAGTATRSRTTVVTAELILTMLERMHLLEKTRPPWKRRRGRATTATPVAAAPPPTTDPVAADDPMNRSTGSHAPALRKGASSVAGPTGPQDKGGANGPIRNNAPEPFYVMHDAIVALCEDMAARRDPTFAPPSDEDDPEDGKVMGDDGSVLSHLRSAAAYIKNLTGTSSHGERVGSGRASEADFHGAVVASLGDVLDLGRDDPDVERYAVERAPGHLVAAKCFARAGEMLADRRFIARRCELLGPVEATRRHVSDLIDMKKEASKSGGGGASKGEADPHGSGGTGGGGGGAGPATPGNDDLEGFVVDKDSKPTTQLLPVDPSNLHNNNNNGLANASSSSPHKTTTTTTTTSSHSAKDFNVSSVIRDAARRLVDEIYRVDQRRRRDDDADSPPYSLTVAVCLSSVGEGLVRCRQARDAVFRLEEAAGVYRDLLGPVHVDVGRALNCVAKALVKLQENRVALLRFHEAARVYEACGAVRHFDAISNSQSTAGLCVDLGDYAGAGRRYEEVLRLRRDVNGRESYQVARTHNEYAAVLARQGRLDEAVEQYREARAALRGAASLYSGDAVDDFDDRFNTTVIDLNIASIRAKKGDVDGAVACYEAVVDDLRASRDRDDGDRDARATYDRHIVAAMGRIGSLKLRRRDNEGALEMFEGVLRELGADGSGADGDDDGPRAAATRLETARAHIKCATIHRQTSSSTRRAIEHLRAALRLYTRLYGPDHRDTQALASSLQQWRQDDGASSVTDSVRSEDHGWD